MYDQNGNAVELPRGRDISASSQPIFEAWASRLLVVEPLTVREIEILEMVCEGWSNCEIAAMLGISIATVKFHIQNIFGKLGVKRRLQAVSVAIYLGLVLPGWLRACGEMTVVA